MTAMKERFDVFTEVVLVIIAVAISVSLSAARADAQSVRCVDPRGCPDLIVDATRLAQTVFEKTSFAPNSCAVIEGEVERGPRKLLRFNFATPNLGPGDLVVGNPVDNPDWFDFDTCHGHPHFLEYADYRLWTVDGYTAWKGLRDANTDTLPSVLLASRPDVAAQMVSGRKFGFCTIDSVPYSTTQPAKYTSCLNNQGISVGWADIYGYQLDGQWIDITDVVPGTYVLEGEVNAERFFEESNYSNNSATAIVTIPAKIPGKPVR